MNEIAGRKKGMRWGGGKVGKMDGGGNWKGRGGKGINNKDE